jgi:lipoprotein-anchoring transpeptidase ErfK/SrfK
MNTLFRSLAVVSCAAFAACLSSCTPLNTTKAHYSTTFDPPAYRPRNPAAVKVKISTGAQRLYVVEGDRVLMATPCSVGKPGSVTPPGTHTIYSKEAKRRSHSYGEYPMPWWCEFSPAYGIHWGFVKPYPCTHGCVRLPKMAAAKLFAMVSLGTKVNVASSQVEDATIGRTLPLLDDTTLPDPPSSYLMTDLVFQDAHYRGQMFVD